MGHFFKHFIEGLTAFVFVIGVVADQVGTRTVRRMRGRTVVRKSDLH